MNIKKVEVVVQVENRHLDENDSEGFPVFMLVEADVDICSSLVEMENGVSVSDDRDSILKICARSVSAAPVDADELTKAEWDHIESCVYTEARLDETEED